MLKENEDVISFVPGYRSATKTVLGRIVVHDRVAVESTVLPRYFNHNSFASLRRQLNYFSFVRLGKGRQRESTYLNEAVIALDDILSLKRRSSGGGGGPVAKALSATLSMGVRREPNLIPGSSATSPGIQKRGRVESPKYHLKRTGPPPVSPKRRVFRPTVLPLRAAVVSDDEQSQGREDRRPMSADSEPVNPFADDDILAGCSALLGLAGQGWGST
jgi:hypothetical protein